MNKNGDQNLGAAVKQEVDDSETNDNIDYIQPKRVINSGKNGAVGGNQEHDNSGGHMGDLSASTSTPSSAGMVIPIKREEHTNDRSLNGDDEEDSDEEDSFVPDYAQANKLSFRQLCHKLETVSEQRYKKKKPPKDELLAYLVPKPSYFKGGSIFPILRLMVPDHDMTRPRLWMKESTIATTWGNAIGLNPKSKEYKKLTHYNNPQFAGPTAAGNLPKAIYEVMKHRFPETDRKNGGVTVGEMNIILDQLAGVGEYGRQSYQQQNQQRQNPIISGKVSKGVNGAAARRRKWVERLINKKFSPLEHKWIVKIILGRMDLGVGSDSIIGFIHQYAQNIYAGNKNLQKLCNLLCNKELLAKKTRKYQGERETQENILRYRHFPRNQESATLFNTIDPMLSEKTNFGNILSRLRQKQKQFAETLEKDNPAKSSLALTFPAFTCEVKLDGERMLAHMKKGVVKIQTRNTKWYSEIYSPVIAPIIRRAIEPYKIDIILDGEMLSWDDLKKETVPFGENRGVAKLRKNWLRKHGKLDPRDNNIHSGSGDLDVNVVQDATLHFSKDQSVYGSRPNPGCDVWLKYIVFDILYLGGPDAQKVIDDAFPFLEKKPTATGSIVNLDLMQRKRILYTLLKQEKNMLEICETTIVRSDGTSMNGQCYFTSCQPCDFGYPPMVLDSVNYTIDGVIRDVRQIDSKRRQSKNDKQIDKKRANALDIVFADIVTKRQLEGVVFKDLASSYLFGRDSRKLGNWFKLKEDYVARGHAADIDVVVVGGKFATGARNVGLMNSFTVACLDDDTSQGVKYMTLGDQNGNNLGDAILKQLLESTGFVLDKEGKVHLGSWFATDKIPDFISKRSFQTSSSGDLSGWKAQKKHRPDLWINPEDSFVLSLKSGEVINSKEWSAGVSLRFPRIRQNGIRKEGFGDPKPPTEIETVKELHEIYYSRRAQQEAGERESQYSGGTTVTELQHGKLFATAEQATEDKQNKTKNSRVSTQNVRVPETNQSLPFESDIFKDQNFTVLDGEYEMNASTLDGQEAIEEGWFEGGKYVSCQQDIVDFIEKHSGNIHLTANSETDFIVGGRADDPRVQNLRKSIEGTTEDMLKNSTKRGQNLKKIHEIGGIVKWNFLFSTVHRFHTESNAGQLIPRRNDFLIMSPLAERIRLQDENIYGLHLYENTSFVDFKRAMMEVKRRDRRETLENNIAIGPITKRARGNPESDDSTRVATPWQVLKDNAFGANEKSILETPRSKILRIDGESQKCAILYPDIFDDLGLSRLSDAIEATDDTQSPRWDDVPQEHAIGEIAASLLLARAIGSKVSPHFHNNVTHVLCDLINTEFVIWNPSISISAFRDVERGKLIHQRLLLLNDVEDVEIVLISPEWLHRQWSRC